MKQLILIIALLSVLSGCRKKPVPLPPRPLVPPPPQERFLKIAEVEVPPELEVLVEQELPQLSLPISKVPPPRIRRPRPIVVRKKEAPEPTKPVVQPGAGFRLGELLTPAQRLELSAQTDTYLTASVQVIRTAASLKLSDDQEALKNQIQALMDQARRARNTDLVEARKLAERSKILADALSRSF